MEAAKTTQTLSWRIALLSKTRTFPARSPLRRGITSGFFNCQGSDCVRHFSTSTISTSGLTSWRSFGGNEDQVQAAPRNEFAVKRDSSEPLPWYLQVHTPQQEPKSLSDRQRLPDLPHDSPPLLSPVLQHISVDLGLDDLSLLDLRDIEPPPALGANLVMIIGTARSEKHLHVSADRFCRWLRTAHKLSPYADGLLGRGELRLKLKRKNRRTRMLNSVGASDTSNTDDGIRTGWVCVNVGMIEDGQSSNEENLVQNDPGYIGFGDEASGVKLVVQMLTEEKREDLDLETLWGQALGRFTRKRDRITRGQEEPSAMLEHSPNLGTPMESPHVPSPTP
ncbi:MAG: hypothetical protein Q9222_007812 [Ikaeria aurantiellina]